MEGKHNSIIPAQLVVLDKKICASNIFLNIFLFYCLIRYCFVTPCEQSTLKILLVFVCVLLGVEVNRSFLLSLSKVCVKQLFLNIKTFRPLRTSKRPLLPDNFECCLFPLFFALY